MQSIATKSKQRIQAALRHKTLDRIPICDTYWPETIEKWHQEGLPTDKDPFDYFDIDRITMHHPFDCGFFSHEIYEETDDYIIDLNPYGTVVKYSKCRRSDSGHSELEHKVQTIKDWQKAKENLTVTRDRLHPANKSNGEFTVVNPVDHFWMSFCMLGLENLCVWLMSQKAQILQVYQDYTDFLIGMMDLLVEKNNDFDAVWFFSDMAYCSGPMFSPDILKELISPSYERLKSWCIKHNKYMLLHTDGDINKLIPEYIRIGFDWLHPLETRANNDVRVYKEKYGDKVSLMGNINADIIAEGDFSRIEDEIASKITVAKKNGGYIYHIDHSVSPTISFDSYAYAIEMIKKYGSY